MVSPSAEALWTAIKRLEAVAERLEKVRVPTPRPKIRTVVKTRNPDAKLLKQLADAKAELREVKRRGSKGELQRLRQENKDLHKLLQEKL